MRKTILSILAVLSAPAALALADKDKLGVTLDLTYMSKYISKGSESYGQQGALFKTIDIDLYGTGFGTYVTHRSATSSGYVDKERFDYGVYYKATLFEDKPYLTKYGLRWAYEHYPGLARNMANTTNEWKFSFSWPKLLDSGLVPKYVAYYEYPAGSGYRRSDVTGWVHIFGFSYDWAAPGLSPRTEKQLLTLSADIAYTDGLGGKTRDHDWSYATFGVSTSFKIDGNLSFIPAVYHQLSMDDSVAKRDITYCSLSMRYKF